MCDVPSDILLIEPCNRQNGNIPAFHSSPLAFSNLHPAEFVIDNVQYKEMNMILKVKKGVTFDKSYGPVFLIDKTKMNRI